MPPKSNLETTNFLRKTIKASSALANLNGAIINLPNPQLFLDTISLQEAKASSEIENIITTNDELYKSAVVANNSTLKNSNQIMLKAYSIFDLFNLISTCSSINKQIKSPTLLHDKCSFGFKS